VPNLVPSFSKWFAAADREILADLGEAQSIHLATGGDALALGLVSQAALGLFVAGDCAPV
jgi:hypothetical protein